MIMLLVLLRLVQYLLLLVLQIGLLLIFLCQHQHRVNNLVLEVRQDKISAGNADNDNFGIDYVSFVHDEVEQTITTYPSGKTDLGIEFIKERIEPQGDPINSAGLEVNEGTFTLSSAVKVKC